MKRTNASQEYWDIKSNTTDININNDRNKVKKNERYIISVTYKV